MRRQEWAESLRPVRWVWENLVGVLIRLATAEDLGAVRNIFNYYVTNSTCTFQVELETAEERLVWFTGRGPAHPVTVAVDESGEVIGWAALSVERAVRVR